MVIHFSFGNSIVFFIIFMINIISKNSLKSNTALGISIILAIGLFAFNFIISEVIWIIL